MVEMRLPGMAMVAAVGTTGVGTATEAAMATAGAAAMGKAGVEAKVTATRVEETVGVGAATEARAGTAAPPSHRAHRHNRVRRSPTSRRRAHRLPARRAPRPARPEAAPATGAPATATATERIAAGAPDATETIAAGVAATARRRFAQSWRAAPASRLGAVAEQMRPLYLIAGTDAAKIDATRARLRARAEREGGGDALEVFEPGEGRGMPDHEALLAAIPAMSLIESRRYLLADGVERWRDRQLGAVAAAVGALPPDLTLVLIARAKAPAKLVKAVEAAGGEVHEFEAPKARDMPRALVADASRLGFRLEPTAARMLVDRMGANPVRLANELRRLALWAGEGGEVAVADLDAMIADTSEAAVWSLSDALLEGDAGTALRIAERLLAQGENVTGLIYGLASRLRSACTAAARLEEGEPPQQVAASLKMHPYAAKQLVSRLRDAELGDLRAATETLARLELWCRGEADYGDELSLTLALRSIARA